MNDLLVGLFGHTEKTMLLERVESKIMPVTESGCWIWMAGLFSNGYGQIKIKGQPTGAHRVSYELFINPIPKGLCVCHKCDVPSCVNPSHLFVGTHQDNMDDKVAKKRQAKGALVALYGEKGSSSKLTEEQVLSIRDDNRSIRVIAKDYGMAHASIGRIKRRETWKHI